MEKQHRFSFWYILLGIWAVLILHNLLATALSIRTIPYSEFIRMLDAGRVAEVAVSRNQIHGRLKPEATDADGGMWFRSVRVDPALTEMLKDRDVTFKGEIESTFFRDLLSWVVPVLLFAGFWYYMMRRMAGRGPGFMTLGKKKAKVYMEDELDVSFADVAGVDEAKQELTEVIDFLKAPDRFTRLGGKMPRGILLVGPPGTGKTLLAKAVAGESGVPFFNLSGSEFVEMFVGLGAARVRDLFEQARQKAPCIIFVDELDALGKARSYGAGGGHDEREQTLNQLLVEMDGFDPMIGVILMAATNRPEILDPALLRPGRFDRRVLVDRPDKAGRIAILKVHLKNIRYDPNIDIETLANMTPGMVGADLANLVNEAALLGVRRNKEVVGMSEFEEAVERIVAGLEKKNRLINRAEREIIAYHEMGHAIVALNLPGTDPVQKISIIPRGIAALGYTIQTPTEDRFLMRKTELLNRISVLMGGRAAEEVVFSDISTGAQNDLARATDIARNMVKAYGMSTKAGQVYFARDKEFPFSGVGCEGPPEYGEVTADIIDAEIRGIIDAQYALAKKILQKHRGVLEKGTLLLMEREKIDREELETLMETESSAT